jgi:hypothetical protein
MLAIIHSNIFRLADSYPKIKLMIETYKTVLLTMVLYGCETWSLTFGEEHILRLFEKLVSRKIF